LAPLACVWTLAGVGAGLTTILAFATTFTHRDAPFVEWVLQNITITVRCAVQPLNDAAFSCDRDCPSRFRLLGAFKCTEDRFRDNWCARAMVLSADSDPRLGSPIPSHSNHPRFNTNKAMRP